MILLNVRVGVLGERDDLFEILLELGNLDLAAVCPVVNFARFEDILSRAIRERGGEKGRQCQNGGGKTDGT